MRPPICDICGKRGDQPQITLINFKLSKNDIKWQKMVKKTRRIEHPPYAFWFCEEHLPIAKKYEHLPWIEAMKLIKKEIGK